jgi:hypothetical protein
MKTAMLVKPLGGELCFFEVAVIFRAALPSF